MFYTKTSTGYLNIQRLDADFYRPDYLNLDEKLKTLPNIALGKIGQFFSGPFGSKLPSNLYLDKGIPLFRVSNVGQFEVLLDGMAYLDESVHKELITSEVIPGDLLVVKASVGEKICKVPEWLPKANITQHIIGIRPNGVCDIDYVSAFLFSSYGVGQLQRYSLGSIIKYLGITDAKSVILYNPKSLVQKYIGEKVRQAELLLIWSKSVINKWKNSFKQMYPSTDAYNIYKTCSYKLSTRQIADVLTPESYPPEVEKYFQENNYLTLGEISECIYTGKTLEPSFDSPCVNQATSRSCSGMFFKNPMNKVETSDRVKPLKLKDLVLTNAAHEKSYIGKDVTFNHSNDYVLPSAKVLVIRIKEDKLPISYIHSYLMTDHGYIQWQSIVRGISAGIHPSDVARIRVPLPINESEYQKMMVADELFIRAGLANQISKQLNEVAVKLVEALIEGAITEDHLIQAHNALEQGDTSLDRAILSQMSEDGYAVAGSKPLFSDLDEFYYLLEQAKALE